jgi:hypothetical protein
VDKENGCRRLNMDTATQTDRVGLLTELLLSQKHFAGLDLIEPEALAIARFLDGALDDSYQPSDMAQEFAAAKDELLVAFVKGAKWWEFHKSGGTMWQSDQHLAEEEGAKHYPFKSFRAQYLERELNDVKRQLSTLRSALSFNHCEIRRTKTGIAFVAPLNVHGNVPDPPHLQWTMSNAYARRVGFGLILQSCGSFREALWVAWRILRSPFRRPAK